MFTDSKILLDKSDDNKCKVPSQMSENSPDIEKENKKSVKFIKC